VGERSSDGLVARAQVPYLCLSRTKTEAEHPPRPLGSSSSPQILPTAYLHDKILVHIKKGSCLGFWSDKHSDLISCLLITATCRGGTF